MKIPKILYSLIALISITHALKSAYEYDLSNFLPGRIVVKINQRRVDNKDYYQIINSMESVKQVFNNAYCLEKLSWAPWDSKKPLRGGMDLIDRKSGRIPEENQRRFGDQVAPRYAFSPIEITMIPSQVFKKTRKAATELLQGIDQLACQTIAETKSFIGITAAEKAGSAPSSIVNDFGSIFGDSDKDASKVSSFQNDSIFDNDSDMPEPPTRPAPPIPKNAIDIDNSIVKNLDDIFGGSSSDSDSIMDTFDKSSTKSTNPCSFGLGTIGSAAGKLAGYTLCKSRQILITFKVDKHEKPIRDIRFGNRPKVIGMTTEGE